MDTVTIRQQLHETIENIDDLDLLELVQGILDHKYHSNPVIYVSDHQKALCFLLRTQVCKQNNW